MDNRNVVCMELTAVQLERTDGSKVYFGKDQVPTMLAEGMKNSCRRL